MYADIFESATLSLQIETFTPPHVFRRGFIFFHPGKRIKNICFRRMRVDGNRVREEKSRFGNIRIRVDGA